MPQCMKIILRLAPKGIPTQQPPSQPGCLGIQGTKKSKSSVGKNLTNEDLELDYASAQLIV